MIGPGWLPGFNRTPRKRTLAYTRMRRRSHSRAKATRQKQATPERAPHTGLVLFDQGPAEFPTATAKPRDPRARAIALVADLHKWLLARWEWLKPRTVPCAVAALGAIAVLESADYLAHQQVDHVGAKANVIRIDIAPR